ncbi:MAG: peptidoglycan-binding protein [Clostridia bacterium]|nr:peptidoglycan-binding protein [Clostridia bacterium]
MKRKGGISPVGLMVIIILIVLIIVFFAAAWENHARYQKEAAVTPTPSITPRTVRITENPAYPTSTPTPCVLQVNSVGIEVKQLQERLKELEYYTGVVDGQYGNGTKAAVKAFQEQHKLTADGIAGDKTIALLYSTSAQVFVPTPTPSPTPALLSNGSNGEEVKTLQERLKVLGYYTGTVDGAFGSGTKAAVKLFQQQNGLEADGMAGQKTLALLYSDAAKRVTITPTPELVQVLNGSVPMLVNKQHMVAKDFVPADLVDMSSYCPSSLVKIKYSGTKGQREAVNALVFMLQAAAADGITNWQVSAAYRSYADQQSMMDSKIRTYMENNNMSRSQAASAASRTVAQPGASEHHTGLAFDMTVPNTSTFLGTKQCTWLHQHCWEYGFIIRYTEEKKDITGFEAEAWHIRYVGKEHSENIRRLNMCLEEYVDYLNKQ